MNDLWIFNDEESCWVSGSNQPNQQGNYGTQNVPNSKNVPGARYDSVAWIDSKVLLWLFGGSDGKFIFLFLIFKIKLNLIQ